ncbi:MAG: ankyrin repeat domain-containing protein, partial [Prevotellaceae bacterium]|nr:ankyrin repeat domain-containing protein [Prevotellaceae bacterium]
MKMIKINKALVAGLALAVTLTTFMPDVEARKLTIGDAIGILGSIGKGSRGSSSSGTADSISNMGKQKHAVMNMNDAQRLLMLGVASGDIEIVSQMLAQGVDVNGVYNDGRYLHVHYRGVTPVLLALSKNDMEMLQFLIEQGADVDGFYDFNNWHVSYIVYATSRNNLDFVKFLHESGAKINGKTKDGDYIYNAANAVLMRFEISVEILEYLINEGVDLEVKYRGKTPLLRAVEMGTLMRLDSW